MSYGHAVQEKLREPARALRRAIPEVYDGYRQMHAAAYAAGALDEKAKELIALAVAVSKDCDGGMASHTRGAARTGATRGGGRRGVRRHHRPERWTGHRALPARVRRLPGVRGGIDA